MLYHENVFVVFLHEVLFAAEFLQFGFVGREFGKILVDLSGFGLIEIALLFQLVQLLAVLVLRKDIVVIKENHPYYKYYGYQEKFVLDKIDKTFHIVLPAEFNYKAI